MLVGMPAHMTLWLSKDVESGANHLVFVSSCFPIIFANQWFRLVFFGTCKIVASMVKHATLRHSCTFHTVSSNFMLDCARTNLIACVITNFVDDQHILRVIERKSMMSQSSTRVPIRS